MNNPIKTETELIRENNELRARLQKTEAALQAMRSRRKAAFPQDISQAKQTYTSDCTEQALRELSDEQPPSNWPRILEILDTIQEGFFELDQTWCFTYLNHPAARGLGFEPDQLIGKNIWETFPDILGTGQETFYRQVMAQQQPARVEIQGLQASKWHELHGYPSRAGIAVLWTDITERKAAEETWSKGQGVFESIFENSSGILNILDEDFRYLISDAITPAYFGLDRLSIVGKSLKDLAPDFILEHGPMMRQVIETGQPNLNSEVQTAIPGDAGEFLAWRASFFPVALPGGKRGIGIMGFDTTDQKKVEQSLRESEERFRTIAEFTYDWEYWITPAGRLEYVSPSCERITGRPPQDFIADPALMIKIVHPEDRGQVKWHLMHDLNNPEMCTMDFRILTAEGQLRWISHICQAVKSQDGRPLGRRASNRDITKRKQAEIDLRYQAALLNNMKDAVIACDQDFCITVWNEAAEKMYGWKAAEVMGQNMQEIVQTLFPQTARTKILDRIAVAGGWQGEVTQTRKDGDRFAVDAASAVLHDERGRISGYLSVNRDITQRKTAEERLDFQADILENVHDAIIATDAQLNITWWNHAAEELYGWTRTEVIGKQVSQYLRSDLSVAERNELLKTTSQTGGYRGEVIHHSKSGKRMVIEGNTIVRKDHTGQVLGYISANRDDTEHKLQEIQLKENEQRYRSLFENMTEGFAVHEIVLNEDGIPCDYRFLDINPAFERLTGLKRADVVGQLKSIVLPTDDAYWLEIYGKVALSGEPVHFENHSSGLNRDYEVFAYRPAPLQFAVLFIEITERKKAEANLLETARALKESEEHYRNLFNTMLQGVVYQDADGTIISMNPAAEQILGKTRAEFLGETSVSVEHDTLREDGTPFPGLEHPAIVALQRGCEVRDVIMQVYNPRQKKYRFINITAVPQFREGQSQPYQVYTVFDDITARWQAEKQAEEGKYILDALMRYIPEGITIAEGQDITLRMVSQYGQELLGARHDQKTASEVIQLWQVYDKNGLTLLPNEELPLARAIHRGEVITNQDLIQMNANGERLYLSCNAGPIRDESGRITGGVVAWREISERIKSEEVIRKLNQQLSRQAELLLQANSEMESFSYSVSHDLRTPLRAMDGFSAALLEDHFDQLDETGRHYLRRIREASQHMGQLIDDLLGLSRLSRSPLTRHPVDLTILAQEVAAKLKAQAPQRSVQVEIAPGLIDQGDAHLLKTVLENLLDNAFKFTSHCEHARIEVGVEDRAGDRVYFVRDNGVGFDMAYADKLFAPFQRLHSSQEFPGTGIGLVTVLRIIRRHGGTIWTEAAVGQGATFHFTLGSNRE